ncbi:MAG: hypothetical protein ACRC8W_21180 [Plesiomonas shigelloides]
MQQMLNDIIDRAYEVEWCEEMARTAATEQERKDYESLREIWKGRTEE